MAEALVVLEERRQQLYEQLISIGDFRPGMISARYRKCGRGNCACAQPGHAGHGPQYLWNKRSGGRAERRICIWGRNCRRWKVR